MGVKIKYGDIAPEAKENFVPTASEKAEFTDLTELNQYNLKVDNYANPCELYQTILDGSQSIFPEYPENENMGYWSERISDENGNFQSVEIKTKKYVVTGTGTFDNTCGYVEINGVKYTSAFSVSVDYGTQVTVKVSAGTSDIYDRCNIDLNGNRVFDGSGWYNFTVTGQMEINFVSQTSEIIYGFNKWWEAYINMVDDVATEEIRKGYPIELTLLSAGQYSSQGLTLTFDTYNNIYATRLNIKWLRITDEGITILDEKEFTPDNAVYFCHNKVENYNKVVITFYALNMPKNRLKLRAIDYGYGTYFFSNELRDVKIIQEIDAISEKLPIDVCDFTLDSKTDMEYSFQAKQPLSVFYNDKLKATVFVERSVRAAKNMWIVNTEDYIGILDRVYFVGGMYDNQNAYELLKVIFDGAKVPFTMSEELKNLTISGYIPYCTCRRAVQMICFAICAIVKTSCSETVDIIKPSEETTQTIPKSRIRIGQSFTNKNKVTGVKISAYSYTEIPITSEENETLYDASKSGLGENIFVKFSKPMHTLQALNGCAIAIDENGNELKGINYAIINVTSAGATLVGWGYNETVTVKSKHNPLMLASEIENIVEKTGETLVNADNIDTVLDNYYNHYTKTTSIKMQIEEGRHLIKYGETNYGTAKYGQFVYDEPVDVSEVIVAETEYSGMPQGRLISQRYSLNGGIIVKECEMI